MRPRPTQPRFNTRQDPEFGMDLPAPKSEKTPPWPVWAKWMFVVLVINAASSFAFMVGAFAGGFYAVNYSNSGQVVYKILDDTAKVMDPVKGTMSNVNQIMSSSAKVMTRETMQNTTNNINSIMEMVISNQTDIAGTTTVIRNMIYHLDLFARQINKDGGISINMPQVFVPMQFAKFGQYASEPPPLPPPPPPPPVTGNIAVSDNATPVGTTP